MSAIKKLSELLPTAALTSSLSMLCLNSSGSLVKKAITSLFTAVMVNTVADIKAPGVYRLKQQPSLPNGASLEYSAVLCLSAGMDLYLLAFTHTGSAAFGFLNNGTSFSGWNMMT
ncbi:MAG: hypothetical protein K2K25_12190 [Muribaculaceae bacterium]|nr:hypothetical protein [Muribaculaceae bacterium]